MLDLLVSAVSTTFFAAGVVASYVVSMVAWALVSLVEVVFTYLCALVSFLALTAIPAAWGVLETVVAQGLVPALQVTVNLISQALQATLTSLQVVMLYLSLLVSGLFHLFGRLFLTVVNQDWPFVFKTISSASSSLLSHFLRGVQAMYHAVAFVVNNLAIVLLLFVQGVYYVIVQLSVSLYSILAYSFSATLFTLQTAVYMIIEGLQLLFQMICSLLNVELSQVRGLSFRLEAKKVLFLLFLLGCIATATCVLYALAIRCILWCMRKKHEWKNRRPAAQRQEARPPSPRRRQEPLYIPAPPLRRRRPEPEMLNDMDIQQERVPTVQQRWRMPPAIPLEMLPDNNWSNEEADGDVNNVNSLLTLSRGKSPVESVGRASSVGNNTSVREDEDAAVQSLIQQLEGQLAREMEDKLCVVCLDKPRKVMLRPCNHYCVCEACIVQLRNRKCPICQKRFSSSEKIFNV